MKSMPDPSDVQVRVVEVDGDVAELAATTPGGDITVITGMAREGDTLVLRKLHIDGPGAGSFGLRELRGLGRNLGRLQGAKRVKIYGSARTTGANPGHTPRPITISVGDEQ